MFTGLWLTKVLHYLHWVSNCVCFDVSCNKRSILLNMLIDYWPSEIVNESIRNIWQVLRFMAIQNQYHQCKMHTPNQAAKSAVLTINKLNITYWWIRCFDKDSTAITICLVFLDRACDVTVFAGIWIIKWEWHINTSDMSINKHLETSGIFICTQLSSHNYMHLHCKQAVRSTCIFTVCIARASLAC